MIDFTNAATNTVNQVSLTLYQTVLRKKSFRNIVGKGEENTEYQCFLLILQHFLSFKIKISPFGQ